MTKLIDAITTWLIRAGEQSSDCYCKKGRAYFV